MSHGFEGEERCSYCDGSGEGFVDGSRCHVCHGSGMARDYEAEEDAAAERADQLNDEARYDRDY